MGKVPVPPFKGGGRGLNYGSIMNFLFVQLSQEPLMLVVRIRGKMISTIRQVRNTSSAGYSQIIDKPTHIANNSMSYVDLIFCTKANVVSKHGVDVSIFEKYDHNITFGKTDIRLPLPLVYVQLVRDYTKANAKNIKKAISNFNCNKAF